jgi:hypothetical protein
MPARKERVLCEHHISRLTSEYGLQLTYVVDVARDSLDCALTEPSVPWSGGRAKQERAVFLSWTEPGLGLLENVEAQDLLSDEDEVLVDERDRDFGVVAASPRCRVSGRGKAQEYAVRAREIAKDKLAAGPDDPNVARREVGIFTDDDVAFGAADIEQVSERVARTVGAALRDHHEAAALHFAARGGSSGSARRDGRGSGSGRNRRGRMRNGGKRGRATRLWRRAVIRFHHLARRRMGRCCDACRGYGRSRSRHRRLRRLRAHRRCAGARPSLFHHSARCAVRARKIEPFMGREWRGVRERVAAELAELRVAVGRASTATARARHLTHGCGRERGVDDPMGSDRDRVRAISRGGMRGRARPCLERAAARSAVAKAWPVRRIADLAAPRAARDRRRRRREIRNLRHSERRSDARRDPLCRRSRDRGWRAVCVLTAKTNGWSGRRDAWPEPLPAFLAERQMRRVLASTRRARHDVGLPAEITFPVGDNMAAPPSSALRRPVKFLGPRHQSAHTRRPRLSTPLR